MLINIKQLNETIKHLTLDNGLNVYLYDNPNLTTYGVNYTTFFGSNDLIYLKDGLEKTLPVGIAHFFEHVMFAMEDGDYFEAFSKLGASPNAYTSYNQTSYTMNCYDNFSTNLTRLIKMVQTPYFTDELVAKEMNIINEEIVMYDQIPEWKIRNYTYLGICNQTNYKNDIAGSKKTIAKINKKFLYDIFNTFYIPSNQVLVLSGNFKDIDIQQVIKDAQCITTLKPPVAIIRPVEDNIVLNKEMNYIDNKINCKLQSYCLKFPVHSKLEDNLIDYFLLCALVNGYFGSVNEQYERAIENKIINHSLDYFVVSNFDIKLIMFEMTIEDGNALESFVNNQLEVIELKYLEKGYKQLLANEIRSVNNRDNFMTGIASLLVDKITIEQYYEILYTLDLAKGINRIKALLLNHNNFLCSIDKK